ncbi:hypothetical protein E2C01_072697 [Portunus trituberculatus]|uniref:Uncharacterized protein n=1 Tax=Portunus trituberculatus TaxID=210409 RepID=A0A5B7IC28_PORTR|nr:hypothetical protein [Portunus trituberculatus]
MFIFMALENIRGKRSKRFRTRAFHDLGCGVARVMAGSRGLSAEPEFRAGLFSEPRDKIVHGATQGNASAVRELVGVLVMRSEYGRLSSPSGTARTVRPLPR